LSRIYIRHVHVVLGMIFKLAVKRKKLVGSPMAGVEIPKEWADEDAEADDRAMTPEQAAKFLDAARGARIETLFQIAFHCGFRPGELLALKWDDLDAEARTLRIDQNFVWRKSGDWYLKKPKTKTSRRTLPLTAALVEALKDHRKRQLEARMKAGKLWRDHGFIFAGATGEPFSPWDLLDDFRRVLKAAGLPETFTPYTARHTMATLLIAGGTNVKAVSERMGHANVGITLAAYTHVLPGMQAEVSEEIERLLKGKK
jgi:integrase